MGSQLSEPGQDLGMKQSWASFRNLLMKTLRNEIASALRAASCRRYDFLSEDIFSDRHYSCLLDIFITGGPFISEWIRARSFWALVAPINHQVGDFIKLF